MLAVTLLLTAIVVAIYILLQVRHRSGQATRRRLRHEPMDLKTSNDPLGLMMTQERTSKPTHSEIREEKIVEYIVLHVMAPQDRPFAGYELLQTLLSNGLRYGEKNIFHRHETKTGRGAILFSLASVNKPGTFELTKMGNYTCPGLSLFMPLKRELDPMKAFDTLLETARQLAEDLGGEIWDENRQALNMDTVAALRTRIRQFEEAQRVPDFFENMQR